MTKKKFYAVKQGHQTGIFTDWDTCQEAIKGFHNADFKSFATEEEAKAFLEGKNIYMNTIQNDINDGYVVAYTDGSFDSKTNRYSYGVVIFASENIEERFSQAYSNPKFLSSKNVAGEIFGVLAALDWTVSNNYEKIKIYYDYEGIEKWAAKEWAAKSDIAKTYTKILDEKYKDIIEIVFQKVKGHSNQEYNELADKLAKEALKTSQKSIKQGENFYVIDGYSASEIETLINKISADFNDISLKIEKQKTKDIYRLELDKNRLTINLFNTGKILVQGKVGILFQIFTTYLFETNDKVNVVQILRDAYKTSIDYNKINLSYKQLFSCLPSDYPPRMENLLKQSIINTESFVESLDYSQYVFPALKALEGHIKFLLLKIGITIPPKQSFFMFDIDKNNAGVYVLKQNYNCSGSQKNNIERCYNYYNSNRHTLIHFGNIIGSTDDARIISTHDEAKEIIKEVLTTIQETI